jgi:hypothetical protein
VEIFPEQKAGHGCIATHTHVTLFCIRDDLIISRVIIKESS